MWLNALARFVVAGGGAWYYWGLMGGAFWRLDSREAGTAMWMNLWQPRAIVHMPLYYVVLWYALVLLL